MLRVSLDVEGQSIMSQGEFVSMVRGLDPDGRGSGALAAWFAGETLTPEQLLVALEVEARLAVLDPSVHDVIDVAVARLRRAFPQLGLNEPEDAA